MHAITVIQANHVIIEAVLVAAIERVVQQVDIIIINNNGMHLTVVLVVLYGLVIIKLVVVVVVMIVTNHKLVPVVEIVNRIRVGGTVHHETKTKIKLSNIPLRHA